MRLIDLDDMDVQNLLGLIDSAPIYGRDSDGVVALKYKIRAAAVVPETDGAKVRAKNGAKAK